MGDGKTLGEITAEVKEINIEKGWRLSDGPLPRQTFGDYIALLHSEASEALEAYRDHRLADATKPLCGRAAAGEEPCPDHGPSKPEGVGAELADVLIRLVDMADVFGIDLEREVVRKIAYNRTRSFHHGGRTLADPPIEDEHRTAYNALWAAMPTDPRDWWTGDDLDEFIDQWNRLKLPELTMSDGNGEVMILWTKDLETAASRIGAPIDREIEPSFEIRRGKYVASFMQADKP